MPFRCPLIFSFTPLILISLAMGITTVMIFATMHDHAIHSAMETSIKDSLRFVEEKIAGPMNKLRADVLQLRENIHVKNAYAYQPERRGFNGTWDTDVSAYHGLINDMIIAVQQNGYPYVYQSFRLPHMYSQPHNSSSINPDDYPWGAVLATNLDYGEIPFTEAVHHAYTYSWANNSRVVDWPGLFPITPWDTRPFAFTQGILSLTPQERDGKWHSVEIWIDREAADVFRVLYTFSVPISFDPNGHVTSAMSIDMDCASWMVAIIKNMNIVASDVTIVVPESQLVLATSFASLEPGYERPNASDTASFKLWNASMSVEGRLSSAMAALKGASPSGSFADLPSGATVEAYADGDWIFSGRPVRQGSLNLLVVLVTSKAHYFEEGETARNQAVGIAAALIVVLLVCTILNAVLLTRPLSRLGERMYKTASLQDEDEDDESSVLSEVASMQEAYNTMKAQLGRLKSYLPQSVLMSLNKADDEDEFDVDEDDEGNLQIEHSSSMSSKPHHSSSFRQDAASNRSNRSSTQSHSTVGSVLTSLNTTEKITTKNIVVVSFNLLDFLDKDGHNLVRCQKEYLEIVQKAVREAKGVIDFFQGDHVVATFNAVTTVACPTKRAAVAAHNAARAIRDDPTLPFKVAIGLSGGAASVGNTGTKDMQRFNILGAVYSRAMSLQRLATQQLKEETAADTANDCLSNYSRILTTAKSIGDIDFDMVYQAVDIVCGVKNVKVLKPASDLMDCFGGTVIIAIEGLKKVETVGEWMYQVRDGDKKDALSVVNGAFAHLVVSAKDGHSKLDDVRTSVKNITDADRNLRGLSRLNKLLEI